MQHIPLFLLLVIIISSALKPSCNTRRKDSRMDDSTPLLCYFLLLCSFFMICLADSSPLQDVCPLATQDERLMFFNGFPCKNPNTVMASDFKTSSLNHAGDTDNFLRSCVMLVTATEFPGLNTQGLSISRTDLLLDGMVLPHSHPRASEMLYVGRGTVLAGFVDTKNRMFQRTLGEGDVFVFPRGMLHFSLNAGYGLATTYSVLNSQNPGVVSIAGAMFSPESSVAEQLVARMLSLRSVERNSTAWSV